MRAPSRAHMLTALSRLIVSRGEDIPAYPPHMWRALFREAYAEGVAPLVYRSVRSADLSSEVPPDVLQALQVVVYRTASVNAMLSRELARVAESAYRLPAPPRLVILKGMALLPLLYGDAALRPLQDIDLLVRPEDLPCVAQLLEELGYEQMPLWDEHFATQVDHHLIFHLRRGEGVSLTVEVHRQPISGHRAVHTAFGAWLWAHTEPFALGPTAFPHVHVPTPTAHLLYLVFHQMVQHGLASTRLIWLYDVHLLVQRCGARVTWEEAIRQAERLGWEKAFGDVVALTRVLFNTPWPPEIGRAWPADEAQGKRLVARMGTASGRAEALWREWAELPWRGRGLYLWRKLFPTGEYMRWKYRPKPAWLWPLWYPYRWWSAARESAHLALQRLIHRRPKR